MHAILQQHQLRPPTVPTGAGRGGQPALASLQPGTPHSAVGNRGQRPIGAATARKPPLFPPPPPGADASPNQNETSAGRHTLSARARNFVLNSVDDILQPYHAKPLATPSSTGIAARYQPQFSRSGTSYRASPGGDTLGGALVAADVPFAATRLMRSDVQLQRSLHQTLAEEVAQLALFQARDGTAGSGVEGVHTAAGGGENAEQGLTDKNCGQRYRPTSQRVPSHMTKHRFTPTTKDDSSAPHHKFGPTSASEGELVAENAPSRSATLAASTPHQRTPESLPELAGLLPTLSMRELGSLMKLLMIHMVSRGALGQHDLPLSWSPRAGLSRPSTVDDGGSRAGASGHNGRLGGAKRMQPSEVLDWICGIFADATRSSATVDEFGSRSFPPSSWGSRLLSETFAPLPASAAAPLQDHPDELPDGDAENLGDPDNDLAWSAPNGTQHPHSSHGGASRHGGDHAIRVSSDHVHYGAGGVEDKAAVAGHSYGAMPPFPRAPFPPRVGSSGSESVDERTENVVLRQFGLLRRERDAARLEVAALREQLLRLTQ